MTGKLSHKMILSAGMPRAGSAWLYHLTRDLWIGAGGDDIRELRDKYPLETVITEKNQNIDNFTLRKTLLILLPFLMGKSFTLKIHFAPMPLGRLLLRMNWIRPTYIYRDPRDALLSAYEYGRRVEKTGRVNAFSHLDTIEKAVDFMTKYMKDWTTWMHLAQPAIFRYEDLLTDYDTQADRLVAFLGLDHEHPKICAAVMKNRPRDAAKKEGGHYNKGRIGRFRNALSEDQIALCNARFSPFLEKMGYEI